MKLDCIANHQGLFMTSRLSHTLWLHNEPIVIRYSCVDGIPSSYVFGVEIGNRVYHVDIRALRLAAMTTIQPLDLGPFDSFDAIAKEIEASFLDKAHLHASAFDLASVITSILPSDKAIMIAMNVSNISFTALSDGVFVLCDELEIHQGVSDGQVVKGRVNPEQIHLLAFEQYKDKIAKISH